MSCKEHCKYHSTYYYSVPTEGFEAVLRNKTDKEFYCEHCHDKGYNISHNEGCHIVHYHFCSSGLEYFVHPIKIDTNTPTNNICFILLNS